MPSFIFKTALLVFIISLTIGYVGAIVSSASDRALENPSLKDGMFMTWQEREFLKKHIDQSN